VEALVKQYDRAFIPNTGDRFRFTTLQSRFATFVDLWDRGLRAREEGRSGPFSQKRSDAAPPPRRAEDKVVHVASFRDPTREMDKLHDLHASLLEARREAGETPVPFHRFAEIVKAEVQKLNLAGGEVAFRVIVKDGKVNLTARATRRDNDER
jgi:hypothetical protein